MGSASSPAVICEMWQDFKQAQKAGEKQREAHIKLRFSAKLWITAWPLISLSAWKGNLDVEIWHQNLHPVVEMALYRFTSFSFLLFLAVWSGSPAKGQLQINILCLSWQRTTITSFILTEPMQNINSVAVEKKSLYEGGEGHKVMLKG